MTQQPWHWNSGLAGLNAISDSAIALAYFLIPFAIIRIIWKRRDARYDATFFTFVLFVVVRAIGYLVQLAHWQPDYWSTAFNVFNATIYLVAFVLLMRFSSAGASTFEQLFEFSPDAIFVTDAQGRIRDINHQSEEMFGYTRDELAGQPIETIIPARFRHAHPGHTAGYHANPRTRSMGVGLELFGLRKDGSEVPVDIMLKPVTTVQGTQVLSFVRDVSTQRAMQDEVKRANRQLTSVLESTTVGVVAIDTVWKISYLNSRAKALLQADENMLGCELWAAFPHVSSPVRHRLQRVMASREPDSYEDWYQPLDLTTVVQVHPWEDGGIVIYFSDMSQQRLLERQLVQERETRNQRMASLGRFSGELAHEIRNPLAIIHARASDLEEQAAEEETLPSSLVATTCGSIVKTSERALRILRGIVALARDGTRDPMVQTDIAAIIDQTIELVRPRYTMGGILLEAFTSPDLPRVFCREVQIGQILINLLNNAFDAIEASPASERWVRVEVSADQSSTETLGWLNLDVIDGGPGVPPEVAARLMEMFFTTKPLGQGAGVGLSVSRKIAEDHGGNLELQTRNGHTCFRLTLPLSAELIHGVTV